MKYDDGHNDFRRREKAYMHGLYDYRKVVIDLTYWLVKNNNKNPNDILAILNHTFFVVLLYVN